MEIVLNTAIAETSNTEEKEEVHQEVVRDNSTSVRGDENNKTENTDEEERKTKTKFNLLSALYSLEKEVKKDQNTSMIENITAENKTVPIPSNGTK